jgi:hypothetical protein
MWFLRFLPSLFLVCVISSPSYADTLVKRYKDSNLYKIAPRTYKLVVGGGISNAHPFDSDGPMEPQTYKWSDVVTVAPNVYRLKKGDFGYTVFKNTGEIWIHPVRKRWDLYWSVAPNNPVTLEHRQINSKYLELYVSTPQIRYSFFIGDRGFKINSRLKASYSGGDEWSYTYKVSLSGLTRQGKALFYDGVAVANLPDPFMMDAEGTVAPVQESLNGGSLTVTATGIDSLVLPIDIDPAAAPINPSQDCYLVKGFPQTSTGGNQELQLRQGNNGVRESRPILHFDITPVVNNIKSATLRLYNYTTNVPIQTFDAIYYINRMTDTNFDCGTGVNQANEVGSANWNWKAHSSVAWTSGVGAEGDFTTSNRSIQNIPSSDTSPSWWELDISALAAAETSNTLGVLLNWDDPEVADTAFAIWGFRSQDYVADPDLRPQLVIVFRNNISTHLGYRFMEFF